MCCSKLSCLLAFLNKNKNKIIFITIVSFYHDLASFSKSLSLQEEIPGLLSERKTNLGVAAISAKVLHVVQKSRSESSSFEFLCTLYSNEMDDNGFRTYSY